MYRDIYPIFSEQTSKISSELNDEKNKPVINKEKVLKIEQAKALSLLFGDSNYMINGRFKLPW